MNSREQVCIDSMQVKDKAGSLLHLNKTANPANEALYWFVSNYSGGGMTLEDGKRWQEYVEFAKQYPHNLVELYHIFVAYNFRPVVIESLLRVYAKEVL